MDDCIFCKIVAGEVPCEKVAESEDLIAFLDIAPVADGHTLIIPKQHCTNVLDMPEYLGSPLLQMAQHVGNAVIRGLGADGFNFVANNGKAAGQDVFHAHFHIIPRKEGDGKETWPRMEEGERADLAEVKEKILAALE